MRHAQLLLVILAAMLLPLSSALAGATLYVRASGSDTANGQTPDQALRTIQAAVNLCTSNKGGYTIYVGPGVYTERVRIVSTGLAASGTLVFPNRIVADTTGDYTYDTGGRVVISGNSSLMYGVEISGRNNWQIDGFSFTAQTTAGVAITAASGIAVTRCRISVGSTTSYAIYSEAYNSSITDNTIVFAAATGHGIYLRCQFAGAYVVERNRVCMTGAAYLSTSYRASPSLPVTYGIYANITTDLAVITLSIANNVITDRHTGCFVAFDTALPACVGRIDANTIVGCTYPLNLSITGIAGFVTNNIVSSCYYGGVVYIPLGTLSGFLEYDTKVALNATVLARSGIITGFDPMFLAPAYGDFSLGAGSRAIDAGALASGPAKDLNGHGRPADGNRDLVALPDLGAVEYRAPSGLHITAWNQKDQRNVPRAKLPVVLPLKIGINR